MWDYLIIGAGTAGCVLAHELSQSPANKVLLVEAGGKPPLLSRIPAGMPKLFRSKADWAFETEPQAACGGRRIFTPRGRMLGGSSNMNAQIHQWCHPADYAGWVRLGAEGWGWDEVAPVFRSMENWSGESGDQSRGRLGPMHVARPALPCRLADAFVDAARAAGLGDAESYNGCAYEGAWRTEQAHRGGSRFSAYHAYLEPAMRRRNLEVVRDAQAARLLFEGGRAAGVRLVDGREFAAAHVILSAGAFGSPQLLMLSGIGPAEILREHGIEVRRDAPAIGADLQDHPLVGLNFASRRPLSLKSADTLGQLLKWLMFRRGLLSSNGIEAMAFASILDREGPDLELIFANLEWRSEGLEPPQVHAYAIAASAVAPHSRGRLWLRSVSPLDPPRIDPGLLSDPEGIDAKVILEGLKLARRIAATEPLASETLEELPPSAEARSDDALIELMHREIQTVYHPAGTCRMGDDDAAPVDPRLRLRGIDRLWVADASVMPTVPRGHPNAVVAMIAKRAAEWIARDAAPAPIQAVTVAAA